jgi:hypothetical protein
VRGLPQHLPDQKSLKRSANHEPEQNAHKTRVSSDLLLSLLSTYLQGGEGSAAKRD